MGFQQLLPIAFQGMTTESTFLKEPLQNEAWSMAISKQVNKDLSEVILFLKVRLS